ncbi:hypothetical protein T484DRAFT_1758001 [Baffinella frigidus]|nr:hypothetical protein T484DRAFT_1758001 [Cryptophyta sp. CCMP2293]
MQQSLVIVHLRSQIQILRSLLLEMGVSSQNLDTATGVSVTGVDGLGMQQEMLDEIATGVVQKMSYKTAISTGSASEHVDGCSTMGYSTGLEAEDVGDDFLDDLIGVAGAGDISNDIESLIVSDREYNEHNMLDDSL